MAYVAKEVVQSQPEATKYYELFVEEATKDVNDNDVTILKSVGKYNLTQLEEQKTRLQEQVTDIDAKIAKINELNG